MIESRLNDIKNKYTATKDYLMGRRSNTLGNLETATPSEIKTNKLLVKILTYFEKARARYTVEIDRFNKKLVLSFYARSTPSDLIDNFLPDDSERQPFIVDNTKYDLDKYIDSYKNGKVSMIFDVEGALPKLSKDDLIKGHQWEVSIKKDDEGKDYIYVDDTYRKGKFRYKDGTYHGKSLEEFVEILNGLFDKDINEFNNVINNSDYIERINESFKESKRYVEDTVYTDSYEFMGDTSVIYNDRVRGIIWYQHDGHNLFYFGTLNSPTKNQLKWLEPIYETDDEEDAQEFYNYCMTHHRIPDSVSYHEESIHHSNRFKETHKCLTCGKPIGECTCSLELYYEGEK